MPRIALSSCGYMKHEAIITADVPGHEQKIFEDAQDLQVL